MKNFGYARKYRYANKLEYTDSEIKNMMRIIIPNNIDKTRYEELEGKNPAISLYLAKDILNQCMKCMSNNEFNNPLFLRHDWTRKKILDIIKSSQFDKLIQDEVDRFFNYEPEDVDFDELIDEVPNAYDPEEIYLERDNIGDTLYSTKGGMDLVYESPIIVIDDKVSTNKADIDRYLDYNVQYKHNKFKNFAIGSVFHNIVLLDDIIGNMNDIKQVLKSKGYAKVYHNFLGFDIDGYFPYQRIAKVTRRLYKK